MNNHFVGTPLKTKWESWGGSFQYQPVIKRVIEDSCGDSYSFCAPQRVIIRILIIKLGLFYLLNVDNYVSIL